MEGHLLGPDIRWYRAVRWDGYRGTSCASFTFGIVHPSIEADDTQAFLFDNDDRFFEGWYLDLGWSLTTASWSILILSALGIAASALYLPDEGDYEIIPDYPMSNEQDEQ